MQAAPLSAASTEPLPFLALPESYRREEVLPDPLKPLSSLDWPAEPDEAIFTDPLRRDEPKPLRREELLRIGGRSNSHTEVHMLICRPEQQLPVPCARC